MSRDDHLVPLIKLLAFAVVTMLSVGVLLFAVQNRYLAPTATYQARFVDASGLVAGSDVRIAGVRVGEVTGVRVVDRAVAEVSFDVDRDRPLPAGVELGIKYQDLLGRRYLDVRRGSGPVGSSLVPGDVIPESRTTPPLNLTAVFNGFKPLFQALSPNDVNQLSFEIIQVLQGEGGTVDALLGRTASLTATIANRDQVIGSVITNLNTVLDTVNARDQNVSGLIVNLQELVGGLARDRTSVTATLGPITALTGATAGLLADARPPLHDDVARLGQQAAILNAQSDQVRAALRNVPRKAEAFGRAASYGSWFTTYLCRAGGTVTTARPGAAPLPGVPVSVPVGVPVGDAGSRCDG
jgi:phospholipid/cholesterol/gamma-HCH transport system substrate-binding protein